MRFSITGSIRPLLEGIAPDRLPPRAREFAPALPIGAPSRFERRPPRKRGPRARGSRCAYA